MSIGLLATLITVFVGAMIGIVAGLRRRSDRHVLMRLTDFFLVLPTFVLAIILAPVILDIIGVEAELVGMRATLLVIVVVIGITSWASTARIIRSQTLSIRERMFVDRARVIGAGSGHIMRRHILPNVVNLIVAQAVITFAAAVFTETSLSFIGLGDPFAPSWGQILDSAQSAGAPGLGAWWYIAPPAVCVVLVVLSFTLVGNALDDILNPKSAAAMTDPRDELRMAAGPAHRRPRSGDLDEAREARARRRSRPRRRARRLAMRARSETDGQPGRRSAAGASGRCPSWPTRRRRCSSSRTCAPTSSSSRAGSRRSTASASGSTTARPWASPASRAAARRRPRCRWSGSCPRTPASARAAASSCSASTSCPRPRTSCGAIDGARSASSSRAR